MITYRGMGCLMVNVYKGPLNIRKDLDLILKLLANIVCFPQRGGSVHHDVHLHDIILVNSFSLRDKSDKADGTNGSALRYITKSTCNAAQ
jgi:hypothetical protein